MIEPEKHYLNNMLISLEDMTMEAQDEAKAKDIEFRMPLTYAELRIIASVVNHISVATQAEEDAELWSAIGVVSSLVYRKYKKMEIENPSTKENTDVRKEQD